MLALHFLFEKIGPYIIYELHYVVTQNNAGDDDGSMRACARTTLSGYCPRVMYVQVWEYKNDGMRVDTCIYIGVMWETDNHAHSFN